MTKEQLLIYDLLKLARDAMGLANLITTAAQFLDGEVEDVETYVFDRLRNAETGALAISDVLKETLKEYTEEDNDT